MEASSVYFSRTGQRTHCLKEAQVLIATSFACRAVLQTCPEPCKNGFVRWRCSDPPHRWVALVQSTVHGDTLFLGADMHTFD